MRHIGRVHGISISSMHEQFCRLDVILGHIDSKNMCADIHTKAYSDQRAAEWASVRAHINVLTVDERKELVGSPGLGYVNRMTRPESYAKPDVKSDPWAGVEMASAAEEDQEETFTAD